MGARPLFAGVAILAGCTGGTEVAQTHDASPGTVVAHPAVGAEAGPPFVYTGDLDAAAPGCTQGLGCFVDTMCGANETTALTGTVNDPAGVAPLYDAIVYIPAFPGASLPSFTTGTTSCAASCGNRGSLLEGYVAATETDARGQFTLKNVPVGTDIPLIIQLGKWRREVFVTTAACATTAVPASLTHLPRNQSEGDIPQMAIVTGQCDELACFMSNLGLDPMEFTGPAGGGRLHVYKGAGPGPDLDGGGPGPAGDCSGDACPLWASTSSLSAYDIVLLGCECGAHDETKPAAAVQAMHDWLGAGGRVFAVHYQDTWFKSGPEDFQRIASWLPTELDGPTAGPFAVVSTVASPGFESLELFDDWLQPAGALDADGGLPLPPADVSTSVTSTGDGGVTWITDESTSDPKFLSFSTPIGGVLPEAGVEAAAEYCGRAMFTDVHAGGGAVPSTAPVPASCAAPSSSAEQLALEYLFFNLSGPCAPESLPPPPPPPCGCPQ